MNSAELSSLYTNLEKLITKNSFQNKYIIVFGANKPSEVTICYLAEKGITVNAIIDNDLNKNGKSIFDIRVYTPKELFEKGVSNAIVLIASQYFDEMCLQLLEYGLKKNIDIFKTVTYRNYTIDCEMFSQREAMVLEGFDFYTDLKKKYGDDVTIYLNPYGGLGDAYLIGRYLEVHTKKYNIKNYIVTAVGKGALEIYGMFGIKNVARLSQQQTDILVSLSAFIGYESCGIKILQPIYVHTDIMANAERNNMITWGRIYSEILLGLPTNSEYKEPYIERGFGASILEKNNAPLKKTVILAPYANTMQSVTMEVWELIAQKLSEKGFTVMTNYAGGLEKIVSGTSAIQFPLQNAIDVCEQAGIFIGLRSGICDLISSANCKKIILYPNCDSLSFFGIRDMGLCDDIFEFVYGGDGEALAELVLRAVLG